MVYFFNKIQSVRSLNLFSGMNNSLSFDKKTNSYDHVLCNMMIKFKNLFLEFSSNKELYALYYGSSSVVYSININEAIVCDLSLKTVIIICFVQNIMINCMLFNIWIQELSYDVCCTY